MRMPGRVWDGIGYRFGFNGKENDNEAKGTGNEQDYGMRIYDPRLGRFLSVDPLQTNYPGLAPYQFSSNNPVYNIDLDGLEGEPNFYPKWINLSGAKANKFEYTDSWWIHPVTFVDNAAISVWNGGVDLLDLTLNPVTTLDKAYNYVKSEAHYLMSKSTTEQWEDLKSNFKQTFGNVGTYEDIFAGFVTGNSVLNKIRTPLKPAAATGTTAATETAEAAETAAVRSAGTTTEPTSAFLGGPKGKLYSKQGILESNHLPTMKSIEQAGLPILYKEGSAIQMLYEEHRSFISTGSSAEARAFRLQETILLKRGDYMGAFDLNAKRIRESYGSKYDEAIEQARNHYQNNIIEIWNPPQQ